MTKRNDMPDIEQLLDCKFLGDGDEEFRSFVELMPPTHWSKYDLSAVRLGYEAHKCISEQAHREAMLGLLDDIAAKMARLRGIDEYCRGWNGCNTEVYSVINQLREQVKGE